MVSVEAVQTYLKERQSVLMNKDTQNFFNTGLDTFRHMTHLKKNKTKTPYIDQ